MKFDLKEFLSKLPMVPILVAGVLYLAYGYYSFTTSGDSPLTLKKQELEAAQAESARLEKKTKEAEEFFKNLDKKRQEIRALAARLDEMKATLSEELDIPSFVKMVVTEAQKVGINVIGIKPSETKESEFYAEEVFQFEFQGVYVQFFVFLERLANVERIIRVDDFDVKRAGPSTAPYVEMSGTVKIKTYRYLGSKADEVAKQGGSTAGGAAQKGGA